MQVGTAKYTEDGAHDVGLVWDDRTRPTRARGSPSPLTRHRADTSKRTEHHTLRAAVVTRRERPEAFLSRRVLVDTLSASILSLSVPSPLLTTSLWSAFSTTRRDSPKRSAYTCARPGQCS